MPEAVNRGHPVPLLADNGLRAYLFDLRFSSDNHHIAVIVVAGELRAANDPKRTFGAS